MSKSLCSTHISYEVMIMIIITNNDKKDKANNPKMHESRIFSAINRLQWEEKKKIIEMDNITRNSFVRHIFFLNFIWENQRVLYLCWGSENDFETRKQQTTKETDNQSWSYYFYSLIKHKTLTRQIFIQQQGLSLANPAANKQIIKESGNA